MGKEEIRVLIHEEVENILLQHGLIEKKQEEPKEISGYMAILLGH